MISNKSVLVSLNFIIIFLDDTLEFDYLSLLSITIFINVFYYFTCLWTIMQRLQHRNKLLLIIFYYLSNIHISTFINKLTYYLH